MRWFVKQPVRSEFRRIKMKFAFWPQAMDDKSTVWLEFYFVEEAWFSRDSEEYAPIGWSTIRKFPQL